MRSRARKPRETRQRVPGATIRAQQVCDLARMWWSAFGNTLDGGQLHWVADDLVIGDSTFMGHHVGPFAGVAPSGHAIRLPFVVFVRFREGLLAGERFVYDLMTLLKQISTSAFRPAET